MKATKKRVMVMEQDDRGFWRVLPDPATRKIADALESKKKEAVKQTDLRKMMPTLLTARWKPAPKVSLQEPQSAEQQQRMKEIKDRRKDLIKMKWMLMAKRMSKAKVGKPPPAKRVFRFPALIGEYPGEMEALGTKRYGVLVEIARKKEAELAGVWPPPDGWDVDPLSETLDTEDGDAWYNNDKNLSLGKDYNKKRYTRELEAKLKANCRLKEGQKASPTVLHPDPCCSIHHNHPAGQELAPPHQADGVGAAAQG